MGLGITRRCLGVPANRLYATVYSPGPEDPSCFDQEAYDYWSPLFEKKASIPSSILFMAMLKTIFG